MECKTLKGERRLINCYFLIYYEPSCIAFLVHFQFLWLFGFLCAMSGVSVSVRNASGHGIAGLSLKRASVPRYISDGKKKKKKKIVKKKKILTTDAGLHERITINRIRFDL